MSAKLVLMQNNDVISEHTLSADETTIGRRFGNDIHLDNLGVSGSHAKIMIFGQDVFLEDLNSTNGTFINGNRIDKKLLQNNDLITVGKYQLRFSASEQEIEDDFEKTVILQPDAVSIEPTGKASKAAEEETSTGEDARLVVASGPSKGKSMALAKTVTRLGKPGQQSSAIAKRSQGYYFVNLAGDKMPAPVLNGKALKVGATRLNHGDQITIGNIELTFSNQ